MGLRLGTPETPTTALSTELNSLANDSISALGSAISNDGTGEHWPFAMLELYLAAQGTARSAGASVTVALVPQFATNDGDITADCFNNYIVAVLSLDAATAARRITKRMVPLPPGDYRLAARNNTGQAFAASGNTVKLAQYNTGDDGA